MLKLGSKGRVKIYRFLHGKFGRDMNDRLRYSILKEEFLQ